MAEQTLSQEPRRQVIHTRHADIQPYVTKDNSLIRELMHPNIHGTSHMSVAEATVPVGKTTFLHRHIQSEEIYHITDGRGLMELAGGQFEVHKGDTVCINPRVEHRITNTGEEPLKIIAVTASPYQHKDTKLVAREGDTAN